MSEKKGILSFTEKLGFGLGDAASNFYWKITEFYILYFYTDVFGITPTQAGFMFLMARLWDAVNDPVMGMIADRTKTKWGRYRPYLLWGSIPMSIVGVLSFYTPDFADDGTKLTYAYVTYFAFWMLYTLVNIPYSSLMGVMTPSTQERTELSSFRFVAAFAIGLFVSVFHMDIVKAFGGENNPQMFVQEMGFEDETTEANINSALEKATKDLDGIVSFAQEEEKKANEAYMSEKKASGISLSEADLGLFVNKAFYELYQNMDDEKKAYDSYKDSLGIKTDDATIAKVFEDRPFVHYFNEWSNANNALEGIDTQKAAIANALNPVVDTTATVEDDSTAAAPAKALTLEVANGLLKDSKLAAAAVYKSLCLANARLGWVWSLVVYGILAFILFVACFATTRERVEPSKDQDSSIGKDMASIIRNVPWWMMFLLGIIVITGLVFRGASGYFYLKYFLGREDLVKWFYLSGGLGTLAGVVVMPFVTRFISKKMLYIICMGGGGLLTFIYYVIPPEAMGAVITMNTIIGFIMGPSAALMFAMFADVADYGEWLTGRRTTGLVMAAAMLSLKAGGAVGSYLNGIILDAFNYVPGAIEQSEEALHGILLLVSVIPAVLAIFGALVMVFYKLDNKWMAKVEKELTERKAAEGNSPA